MDNLEIWNIKLCSLLEEITEEQIQTLEDLSDGYLMPNILNKIDPDFFVMDEKISNWNQVKVLVEKYLKSQGIDENLDIDVESIHLKDIKALVAATLQIVSIIAVFNQSEWKKIDFYLNQQKEFEIIQVIKGMISNITEVLQDNEVIVRHGKTNKDIVKILKDLEQKESLLQQNEKELLAKTNIIMEQQQKIDQFNRQLKKKKEEYDQIVRQKNETIQNLENQYYDKSNQEDYKQLQEKIQVLEAEKHENLEKIVFLQGIVEEKTSEIEKLEVYQKIHVQSQQDLEEAKKQRDYYKEKLNQLKKDIELEESNLRILKNADVKVEDLRQQLLTQIEKNKALTSQNKSLVTQQRSLLKRLEQTGETVNLMRRHSARTMLDANSINSNRSIFQQEIFEDESRLNKKIMDYQQRISDSIKSKNFDQQKHKQLESHLRSLELEKQQLLQEKMNLQQQSTALLSDQQVSIDYLPSNQKNFNRNETLQNFFDSGKDENLDNNKKPTEKKGTSMSYQNDENEYEFEELMYTIAWNYAQQNLMQNRYYKERSMFKLFALNDLLNA